MAMSAGGDLMVDLATPRISEQPARGLPGAPMLGLGLAALLGGMALLVWAGPVAASVRAGTSDALWRWIGAFLVLVGGTALGGLTAVAPGEARVVELFGRYAGTMRVSGLRWVNPFARRRRVSTRIRNHETAVAKVNDADGNPIEIAAVVVWRVEDTARATYEVDNVVEFVGIQTETAVRHVATAYAYDGYGREELSLRENAAEITGELATEIARRVAVAGVQVLESRLTRLAYAPEIAPAMLRRQQAGALVAARQRIVEGAVGMVQLALARLEEQDVVDLDPERKAAMVSNLLVVLCSDHPTLPVVNTGSLYH
jgi:regulator of protease activity HflC (stomatin/prohibitin superfamily)